MDLNSRRMRADETASPEHGRSRAKEFVERGQASWQQGNHAAAIVWFTRALEVDPDDAWTRMRRGAARGAIGDVDGAASDLETARAMVPGEAGSGRRHWALAQLGEAIRASIRDAVIRPDAVTSDAEALLERVNASLAAFTEAIRESPGSAWAHAHRGAVAMLAHWIGARMGMDPDWVRGHAEAARRDLEEAARLKDAYSWVIVFQAFLQTILGSNEPEEGARRAHFDRAIEHLGEARRADATGKLVTLLPLVELALYKSDYDQVVELGSAQLVKEPDDTISRYCVAEALAGIAGRSEAGEPAVGEARKATAAAAVEQARKVIAAKRARASAMLGGLAMLQGHYEVAAAMLADVLDYPDMDTLVFLRRDPAWDPVREATVGAGGDPRLGAVVDVYARLFPRTPANLKTVR